MALSPTLIRPKDLTPRPTPVASEIVPSDNGDNVGGSTWLAGVNAARPFASQAEAEAGTSATTAMNPLTTKQAVTARIGVDIASKAQGDKADTAVQPEDLADVATSGDYDDLSGKPTLGTAAAEDVGAFADAEQGQKADAVVTIDGGGAFDDFTDPARDRIIDLASRPKRMLTEKWLLTADWQARVTESGDVDGSAEIIMQRAMMDDIQTYHSDSDFAVISGDLVDGGTGEGGVPALYGFPDLLSDMRARIPSIPLDRWFMIGGNHDRNNTGVGASQYAWSYHAYRTQIGAEYFAIKKGNILQIFMGDMAGSNGGEIIDYVADWFKAMVLGHSTYNIIVWTHQPFSGAHLDFTEVTAPSSVQRGSARFTDVIASVDNILFCGYGHTGDTLDNAMEHKEAFGTTCINFQMGIPAAHNITRDLFYRLMYLADGSDGVSIRSWNASTHAWFGSEEDITLEAKYPIQLGGDNLDFDGRTALDPSFPVTRGTRAHYQSLGELREGSDSSWAVPQKIHYIDKVILGDDSGDSASIGLGVGTAYMVPGAATLVDTDGRTMNAIPAYGMGGGIGFARVTASQENYQSRGVVSAANASSALTEVAEFLSDPSDDADRGVNVLLGGIRLGQRKTWDHPTYADRSGIESNGQGWIRASRGGITGYWQRRASDGQLHVFSRDTTQVGSISVEAALTKYYFTATCWLSGGPGSPEGAITAIVGCEWNDVTNGVKYMKKTGTGNTGWKLVTQAA